MASTVTVDAYVRHSWRNSTSRLFGARVSFKNEMSEEETVFVCTRLRLRWYCISTSEDASDCLPFFRGGLCVLRRGDGYMGDLGVGAKLRFRVFQSAS